MKDITVILNGYRRGNNLEEQYQAFQNQTIKPKAIMLWYNNPEILEPNYEIGTKIPTAYCTANLGVWARFAFALNANTEYICIQDDDSIPGSKWLENCINTMEQQEGLLGTVGLYYPQPVPALDPRCSYYEYYQRYGWVNPNEETKQVDLVGHSWFFKKEWLSDFWKEMPDYDKYSLCGEDMHFSYMLQKYRNIPTFVPPHPKDNREMWGSIKGDYGVDEHSLWESNKKNNSGTSFKSAMNDFFIQQRREGWKLLAER
jgi:hypothetical protein